MTDESNIGLWLWAALIVEINVTWILMDVWLQAHGHEMLTVEVHEGLKTGGWRGLLLCAFIGAAFGIAAYHFFWQR
jgi:hypothetical protein